MQTHFWACEDLRVLILIQMSKDLKKTYIVTNPHTFVIMAGLLYTVFFVTVSINPTKFKACIYLHSLLIKKKYHLNDAWGRQVGCSTTTERRRSPERRLYCYGRVTFLFRIFQRHVLEPIIFLRKAILKLKGQQYWNIIMCRMSFITSTFLKSLSTIKYNENLPVGMRDSAVEWYCLRHLLLWNGHGENKKL